MHFRRTPVFPVLIGSLFLFPLTAQAQRAQLALADATEAKRTLPCPISIVCDAELPSPAFEIINNLGVAIQGSGTNTGVSGYGGGTGIGVYGAGFTGIFAAGFDGPGLTVTSG